MSLRFGPATDAEPRDALNLSVKIRGYFYRLAASARAALGFALMVGGLLAFSPASAQSRYWTDMDGHHYDASILSLYQGQVTFVHPDGRTFTLALTDLVPNDREAVQTWLLHQPRGQGEDPPPTQTLSPYGRRFVLDEPRVLRLRPLQDYGYLNAYLGVPLTLRPIPGSHTSLDFVNVYFFDDQRKPINFPMPPADSPIMIQNGKTTAFIKPSQLEPGKTYLVLIPISNPAVRQAAYDVVVAGNSYEAVATVFPDGSWRDFNFPEHDIVGMDRYADYSGQELYTGKTPDDLFDIVDVTRLEPAASGDAAHDYFRLSLRIHQPFPSAALLASWYAFDAKHNLIHAEDTPPYAQPNRTDNMFIISQPATGPAELGDAITPTEATAYDTVQLPGAMWWDKPEVDSIVFVFGTETKKVARVFSKSGATFAQLPVPEKAAFGDARPATATTIPVRKY